MNPHPTLAEFYDRLARHDWTASMSDDFSVTAAAERSFRSRIALHIDATPEHKALYEAWRVYAWGDSPDKPVRPEDTGLSANERQWLMKDSKAEFERCKRYLRQGCRWAMPRAVQALRTYLEAKDAAGHEAAD